MAVTPLRLAVCDTTFCEPHARLRRDSPQNLSGGRPSVLRALFISLSESRSLRAIAEKSAIGQRLSSRFVAGTQVADAIRVAADLNKKRITVSVDNLGENVTNIEEARASAQLYHQLLDQIAANNLEANVSLKLTHMGLDVDEQL